MFYLTHFFWYFDSTDSFNYSLFSHRLSLEFHKKKLSITTCSWALLLSRCLLFISSPTTTVQTFLICYHVIHSLSLCLPFSLNCTLIFSFPLFLSIQGFSEFQYFVIPHNVFFKKKQIWRNFSFSTWYLCTGEAFNDLLRDFREGCLIPITSSLGYSSPELEYSWSEDSWSRKKKEQNEWKTWREKERERYQKHTERYHKRNKSMKIRFLSSQEKRKNEKRFRRNTKKNFRNNWDNWREKQGKNRRFYKLKIFSSEQNGERGSFSDI